MLDSIYKPNTNVGSLAAVNSILNIYSNKNMVASQISKPLNDSLGDHRKDVIDHLVVKIYDCAAASSDKMAEMDEKLNKICKKLDIEV